MVEQSLSSVDAVLVAPAFEVGGEEGGDAGLGHVDPDQPRAERDGIGVIVAARKLGRERLGDLGAAAGGIAIGGDGDPMPDPQTVIPRSARPSASASASEAP